MVPDQLEVAVVNKVLLSVVVMIAVTVFPASPSLADTDAQRAATDYEACIMQLRHLSKEDITHIMQSSGDLKTDAEALGDSSVRACKKERDNLRNVLVSQNKMDSAHQESINKLEKACKLAVSVALFSEFAKAGHSSK